MQVRITERKNVRMSKFLTQQSPSPVARPRSLSQSNGSGSFESKWRSVFSCLSHSEECRIERVFRDVDFEQKMFVQRQQSQAIFRPFQDHVNFRNYERCYNEFMAVVEFTDMMRQVKGIFVTDHLRETAQHLGSSGSKSGKQGELLASLFRLDPEELHSNSRKQQAVPVKLRGRVAGQNRVLSQTTVGSGLAQRDHTVHVSGVQLTGLPKQMRQVVEAVGKAVGEGFDTFLSHVEHQAAEMKQNKGDVQSSAGVGSFPYRRHSGLEEAGVGVESTDGVDGLSDSDVSELESEAFLEAGDITAELPTPNPVTSTTTTPTPTTPTPTITSTPTTLTSTSSSGGSIDMSVDELNTVYECFRHLDHDNCGYIRRAEANFALSRMEVRTLFPDSDSAVLSFGEWLLFFQRRKVRLDAGASGGDEKGGSKNKFADELGTFLHVIKDGKVLRGRFADQS